MCAWLGRMPWALGGLFFAATAWAAPSTDQLRAWVRQLDAEEYIAREEAGRNLAAAGETAIEALVEGIANGSPEAAWRASSTLEQIAVFGPDRALTRVTAALEGLSQGGKPGLALLSKEFNAKQTKLQRDKAMGKIRELGGRFADDEGGKSLAQMNAEPVPVVVEHLNSELPRAGGEKLVDDSHLLVLPRGLAEISALAAGAAPRQLAVVPPPALPATAVTLPDPPPDLPAEGASPAAEFGPILAIDNVLIADAFAPAEERALVESNTEEPDDSLTLDHRWQGGDAALASLHDLPRITSLRLERAPLTDAALDHIAALTKLHSLDIEGTRFTAAALARFRQRRPETRVFARGEAMLGVHAETSGPCLVTGVFAGSGAAEAGLQPGDEIVAIRGKRISDFSDLTIAVFERKPGDKLPVEFRRGNKRQTTDVLLQGRKIADAAGR